MGNLACGKLLGVILAVALPMLFVGCGGVSTPPVGDGESSSTNTHAPADTATALPSGTEAATQVISDGLGRTVTLPYPCRRVISLSPGNTEILFALGAGEQVIAVTTVDDYPPAVAKLEKVGGFAPNTLQLEKIVSLRPDVVLAAGSLHRVVVGMFERLEVPVVALEALSLDDVARNITLVGKITGRENPARKLTEDWQQRVARVRAVADSVADTDKLKVFYLVWDQPLMSAGPKSFIGQMLTMAGGKNIFDDVGEEYPMVNAETVVERNPYMVFTPRRGGADGHGTWDVTMVAGLRGLRAVQARRVVYLDPNVVSRPGPRLLDALEIISTKLYPSAWARSGSTKAKP